MGAHISPSLANFQNIKAVRTKLRGWIVSSKTFSFWFTAGADGVIRRKNYVMCSKRRPSRFRHLGFPNYFPKSPKITKIKGNKLNKRTLKLFENVNVTPRKLIAIDSNIKSNEQAIALLICFKLHFEGKSPSCGGFGLHINPISPGLFLSF